MSDGKNLKVLVVDDEKQIRDFLVRLLSLDGIKAKTADDGIAAIEAAKKENFDLVFLDVRMPRLNGIQAFSQLKKINPELNCVFVTGYAVESVLIEQLKQPQTFFLKKPFENISQIRVIVGKVLDAVNSGVKVTRQEEIDPRERRVYLRVDAVLEVEYKIKDAPGEFKHCISKNAGPCGMMLCLKENLVEGTVLSLRIKCAAYEKVCEAEAKIVWNKGFGDDSGCYNAGIEFSKIDISEFSEMLIRCGAVGRQS